MPKVDHEKIKRVTAQAIRVLRRHFAELVSCGAKKDHIWWDVMNGVDPRKGRRPRPSWAAQHAARQRAKRAREAKEKKHGYYERNSHIRLKFERSRE